MSRTRVFALLGMLAVLAVAIPAYAQNTTDGPGGGCIQPVTGFNDLTPTTNSLPAGTLWQALSLAFRQSLPFGIWRWAPTNIGPSAGYVAARPMYLRRPPSRLGGWSRW